MAHHHLYSMMCPGLGPVVAGKPLPSSGWLNWLDPYFSSRECGLSWVLLFCSHQTIGPGHDSGHVVWSPGTLRQFSFLQQQLAALDSQGNIVEGPVPITIEVKDINDNRPTFLQSKYEGSVRQNSRPGNRRLTVCRLMKGCDWRMGLCDWQLLLSLHKNLLSYAHFAVIWVLCDYTYCSGPESPSLVLLSLVYCQMPEVPPTLHCDNKNVCRRAGEMAQRGPGCSSEDLCWVPSACAGCLTIACN